MLDGAPLASGSDFSDFLDGLFPHRFCVSCLAKLIEQPEPATLEALQAMDVRLESQTGECRNCAETGQTYRMRENSA